MRSQAGLGIHSAADLAEQVLLGTALPAHAVVAPPAGYPLN